MKMPYTNLRKNKAAKDTLILYNNNKQIHSLSIFLRILIVY